MNLPLSMPPDPDPIEERVPALRIRQPIGDIYVAGLDHKLLQKITYFDVRREHSDKLTKKDVKGVMETLAIIGYKELKNTGAFLVPGFAKFVVIKKPATMARKGINPFTKEPMEFKARAARKVIRARPVKAAKDAV